jgi:hypothetical protein
MTCDPASATSMSKLSGNAPPLAPAMSLASAVRVFSMILLMSFMSG